MTFPERCWFCGPGGGAFHRNITCRLLGHKPIIKMDGTVLYDRHD